MDVVAQAPQPTIKCYHSIDKFGKATCIPYQYFTPNSSNTSGKNLQSYNFERSLENFGGSFSFTIKEDTEYIKDPFMDKVQPLDIIVISESGYDTKRDFVGVVTTVSVGAIASNLNKVVTVSGKSIEWLFTYYNINADIKVAIFDNSLANKTFKTDFENQNGETGYPIKKIVTASIDTFKQEVANFKDISNYVVGDLIEIWFGIEPTLYVDAPDDMFAFPISSNLFEGDRITVIDYIKKLLPPPYYEMFCYIDENNLNKLMLKVRKAPFDFPKADYTIKPSHLTDYTLTRSCEEVYTAFMTYIEGTEMDPSFYMNETAGSSDKLKGYDFAKKNKEKSKIYGYQLLTCSLIGYNDNPKAQTDKQKIDLMNQDLEKWFSHLDEMYTGDFTLVNVTSEKHAKIGEWLSFAKGLYYVITEKHSWNYGDNPMINYQVIRGGEYPNGNFKPLERLSAVYKEFE